MTKSRGIRPRKPWTDEDVNYLIANYGKLTSAKIAAHLGRSKSSLNQQAYIRGLSAKIKPWTEAEIKFLQDNHALLSRKEIAKAIGREFESVKWKMNQLGLFVEIAPTPSSPLIVPIKYGRNEDGARVFRINDRPARLEVRDIKPSARNYPTGSSLGF